MNELTAICCAAREFMAKQAPLWLATVVGVRGSAYRQAGARLLFTTDRVLAGCVSGGCLESEIVRIGGWVTSAGPVVRTFDGSDEEQLTSKTGCGGCVDILIEDVSQHTPCDALAFMDKCIATEQRGVIATVIHAPVPGVRVAERLLFDAELGSVESTIESVALQRELTQQAISTALRGSTQSYVAACGTRALLEVIEPPPALFIFGAGHDALALAQLARAIGWQVTVHARQLRPAVQERFCREARLSAGSSQRAVAALDRCARPLAVIMSHNLETDRDALSEVLRSRARYIGVLGPAKRTRRLLEEIAASRAQVKRALRRVHAPAGLHLGAESPQEIALSIVAEAQAALTRTSARSLRDRERPIHEPTPVRADLRVVTQRGP